MPDRQIFFDPQRKRWKRLRRILDIGGRVSPSCWPGLSSTFFAFSSCPSCCSPFPSTTTRRCPDPSPRDAKTVRPARRKTDRKPSDIPLNTGEGLRAAYYVQDDPASYSSLKEHVHQIDLLFPAVAARRLARRQPDGHQRRQPSRLSRSSTAAACTIPTTATRSSMYPAGQGRHRNLPSPEQLQPAHPVWDSGMGDVLKDPAKRAALAQANRAFLHRLSCLSRPFARF